MNYKEEWVKRLFSLNLNWIKPKEDFINALDQTDYFTRPASIKGFHSKFIGGLAYHSLVVYDTGLKIFDMNSKYFSRLDNFNKKLIDDFKLASLLHDIGKTKGYRYHGMNAVDIASEFISLNEEVDNAISYHMGFYGSIPFFKGGPIDYDLTIAKKMLNDKLTKLLYLCDDLATNVIENKICPIWENLDE